MLGVVTKKNYPDGYPNDALEILKKMSFTDGRAINVVGSMALRSQIYAGDYDADEYVETYGDRDQSLKDLVKKFKKIVQELLDTPLTYIGDIKSGSIEEWKVLGETYNAEESRKKMKDMHTNGIITDAEYQNGMKMLKPHLTRLQLLHAHRDLRYNIIRWSPQDVLKGHKTLIDGRKFTLEEAFQTPTITKMDVVSWVQNSRFTDFSLIYQFKHSGTILNPGMRDIETSIRENIYLLKHEGNYFKMAKRMFALARFKKYVRQLHILSAMFNGDLGRLYHVYGDIGTLLSLIENTGQLPYARIEFEIDQFKGRLSNIGLPKYLSDEDKLFKMIDELIEIRKSTYNKERLTDILTKMKESMYEVLTYYSKQYLKEHNLV
jgi:hypothetical protein